MRVVVVNLTAGGLSGGYRKYVTRLMPLLAADPRVSCLVVFAPEPSIPVLDPGLGVRSWPPGDSRRGYPTLRREVQSISPDVVLIPTARYVSFGTTPIVTMIRNMEPLTVPFGGNTLRESLKNLARAWEAKHASRRASRIIAVSKYVKDFIMSRWHLAADRVGLVYHGVDKPSPSTSDSEGPRFLFTAGSIRPARGLEDVIAALASLPAELRLEIAGQVDPGCEAYAARIRRLADQLGVTTRVRWRGHLGADEMARTFQSCTAFVATSRAEACPNTVLEAMSHGCASISVHSEPMPEFFQDAAVYYPPGDVIELATRVRTLVGNGAEHARLQAAAARRAGTFTWESTADQTIHELERVLA